MEVLIAGIAGFVVALVIVFLALRGRSKRNVEVQTHSSLMEMRSVGELTVFKVVTKEIVTASEHFLGDVGKNYLSWLVSGKKMAMIFEFGIDFKYNLRSSEFVLEEKGEGEVVMRMPSCHYETYIRDISFYDEQHSKLLPMLVPDLISKALGGGFNDEDKNRLKEAARSQANDMAKAMASRIKGEVEKSAEQTMFTLAKGFGAKQIGVDFSKSKLIQGTETDVNMIDQMVASGQQGSAKPGAALPAAADEAEEPTQ